LLIGFGMWWIYFDFVARRPSRPSFLVSLTWVYLHLAMLIGIVVVGVAISEALTERALSPDVASLLLVDLGWTLVTIALLELTLDRATDEPTHSVLSPTMKAVTGILLCAVAALHFPLSTPIAFGVAILALAAQAAYGAVVYYRRAPTPTDQSRTSQSD
jgi:low temperature requirement protein LtrA